ncbi:cyclic pyranopterin monophosphate synthase MoaC [Ignisphaera sp. 4213-co]|uniref:Cyclic pyranopterin monophosphate synthase MoaC n=1 Tax=Ignisphaera cupida TaxID=3050454 RepID=A0ABD4ZA42_9CREN|nr:cyclic pyranopterin monophosphate synthase MoaC [Ignisphaera sp. 4213-co]MDK6029433.1 cyclic pyranopterin monophosphate synthase MoaC [Ignisphaera sp. 4213-co]
MSAKMVDVSGKPDVFREAVAMGCIKLRKETIDRIRSGGVEKGDVLTASSIVAISSAKLAHILLPFCHPIKIDYVEPRIWLEDERLCIEVLVKARERTGAEMEALTAVSIALLNVWDMVKKYEKNENGQYPYTAIEFIRVVEKLKKDVEKY